MGRSKKKNRRSKGSGSVFKKANGNYCVQFTDATGKLKTVSLKDEQEQPIRDKKNAEIAAQKELKTYLKLQDIENKNEFLTKIAVHKKIINQVIIKPEDAWGAYIKDQSRPDSGTTTLKKYQSLWNIFINWLKENRILIINISDIDELTAEEFMNHIWNTGISERTYNTYLQAIKLILKVLLKHTNSETLPFSRINKKTEQQQSRKDFTKEQVCAIFESLKDERYYMLYKPEMRVMINLCCWTGCRGQDACLMEWSSVNFDKNVISYIPRKTRRKTNNIVSVPIHPQLRIELELAWKWRKENCPHVLPNVAERYKYNSSGISQDITALLEHVGIKTKIEAGDDVRRKIFVFKVKNGDGSIKEIEKKQRICQYSMHSFRHTFVSFCANSGVPLSVVQFIVGHSNPAMTRHYTHIALETAKKAINALPQGNQLQENVKAKTAEEKNQKILELLNAKDSLCETDKQILEILK